MISVIITNSCYKHEIYCHRSSTYGHILQPENEWKKMVLSWWLLLSLVVVRAELALVGVQLLFSLCPWDFPGRITGVGCHSLLQGIFPTQETILHLLHWQADSLLLSYREAQLFYYISVGLRQLCSKEKQGLKLWICVW